MLLIIVKEGMDPKALLIVGPPILRRAKRNNMEWQMMFVVFHLFRRLQDTYQFSGQLAK